MKIFFKITVDCVVFAYDNEHSQLKILLIKRKNEPEIGKWALPGGFIKKNEEFIDTAATILSVETGADNLFLEQLKSYSLTGMKKNNRIASVAFYAIIRLEKFCPSMENSHIYSWVPVKDRPKLPFDHDLKVSDGLERIKEQVNFKPIIFELLPEKFTLNQLQKLYEEIYNLRLDNRNFRRKILKFQYIKELDEYEKNVSRRPGKLYQFDPTQFTINYGLY